MKIISHRECHLIGVKDDDLSRFVKEIKTFFEEEKIPEDYLMYIYENEITCCGVRGIMNVAVEIQGPEKQPVENLDAKIYSKIIEICERESIAHREYKPLEFPSGAQRQHQ